MFTRSQFLSIFTDAEICEYLDVKQVQLDYLRNKMETKLLQNISDHVCKETIIEYARTKGIKNYTRMTKE